LAGDAPVLQLITAGCSQEQWQADPHGLAPRDLAMQVVLPEVDGRIGTRAISFKGLAWRCERTEVDVVRYQPEPERMAFVAELARRWCVLRGKPNADKRVALVLANYPNDDARLANGVGLDTPASTVALLRAMQDAGYATGNLPEGGDALIADWSRGVTNNLDGNDACAPPARAWPWPTTWRTSTPGRRQPRCRQRPVGPARAGPHGAQRPLHGVGPAPTARCSSAYSPRADATWTWWPLTTTPTWCPRTTTWRFISGCAAASRWTRWCTWASTATSNGCPAKAWRWARPAGPTPSSAPCRTCTPSSSTTPAKAARPSAAPRRSSSTT
jgi:hypothetical protein